MSRCYTLAQCYYLAKKYHYKLVIIWQMEGGCNISYKDCFGEKQFDDIETEVVEIKTPIVIEKGIVAWLKEGHVSEAFQMGLYEIRNFFRRRGFYQKLLFWKLKQRYPYICFDPTSASEEVGWYGEKFLNWTMDRWHEMKDYLEQGEDFFISAYCGVIRDEEKEEVDYRTILFPKGCLEICDHIMKADMKWNGIHIRRTDHLVCMENSPTELFIEKIEEILAKEPSTVFYLATDDIEVEAQLKNIFPENIVTYQAKVWGRENTKAMWSGIIDFLCLSKCEHIYGSYSSAFSNFAAIYGKKEITILQR